MYSHRDSRDLTSGRTKRRKIRSHSREMLIGTSINQPIRVTRGGRSSRGTRKRKVRNVVIRRGLLRRTTEENPFGNRDGMIGMLVRM